MKRIIAAMLTILMFAGLLTGCAKSKKAQDNPIKNESDGKPVKNVSVGDIVKFGSYEQDNNTSNGKEDIEWLVLAKEGNKILVISRYALDCQPYNTTYAEVTWETCSLRTWLNGTFINNAFNSNEQNKILTTTVTFDNGWEPFSSAYLEDNTKDKVFLLSITETNKYFKSDSSRQCQGTAYCNAQGAYKESNGNCWWWLRSPGAGFSHAAFVEDDHIYDFESDVDRNYIAVRPALWVSIE